MHVQIESAPSVPSKRVFFLSILVLYMHLFFKIDDKNVSKVHIQIKTGTVQGPTTIH